MTNIYTNSKTPLLTCYILSTFLNKLGFVLWHSWSRTCSPSSHLDEENSDGSYRSRTWQHKASGFLENTSNSHREVPVPVTQPQEHTTNDDEIKYETHWPHWHVSSDVTLCKLHGWITPDFLQKKWYCGLLFHCEVAKKHEDLWCSPAFLTCAAENELTQVSILHISHPCWDVKRPPISYLRPPHLWKHLWLTTVDFFPDYQVSLQR